MSDSVKRYETALQALMEEKRRVESERDILIDGERERLVEQYAPQLRDLTRRIAEVDRALAEAQEATLSHPLEGKRVYTIRPVGYSWQHKEERIEGVVELRRPSSQFQANRSYNIPRVGSLFVRLMKKDGTPSLKFETIGGWNYDAEKDPLGEWKLIDDGETA